MLNLADAYRIDTNKDKLCTVQHLTDKFNTVLNLAEAYRIAVPSSPNREKLLRVSNLAES